MDRKTAIHDFDIYLMEKDEWRAKLVINSDTGGDRDLEHFEAMLVFPLSDPRNLPEDIKLQAFERFKRVMKDVLGILEAEDLLNK